jgi:hypothetical protein
MKRRTKVIISISGAVAVAAGASFAVAGASGDDGGGRPITGDAYDKAAAAALAYTHGGRVIETEANDEESAYEVDVVRSGGRQIEVRLDRGFNVAGSSAEDEQRNDPSDG